MNKKALISTLVITACAFLSNANAADGFTNWEAASGTTQDGRVYCSASTVGVIGKTTAAVSVKNISNEDGALHIMMMRSDWNVGPRSTIMVKIDFDGGEPLMSAAKGDGQVLDMPLPNGAVGLFLPFVAKSNVMHISFPDEKEETWNVELRKAMDAVSGMIECMRITHR